MVALRSRLERLQRTYGRDGPDQWRPLLVAVLARPQFDLHRERIMAALCSRHPWCGFTRLHDPHNEGDTAIYTLGWADREQMPGSAPCIRVVVLHGTRTRDYRTEPVAPDASWWHHHDQHINTFPSDELLPLSGAVPCTCHRCQPGAVPALPVRPEPERAMPAPATVEPVHDNHDEGGHTSDETETDLWGIDE